MLKQSGVDSGIESPDEFPSPGEMADEPGDTHLPQAVVNFLSETVAPEPSKSRLITQQRAESIKNKVRAVARMIRILNVLREEKQLVDAVKRIAPTKRLPAGALLRGESGIRREFHKLSTLVAGNEDSAGENSEEAVEDECSNETSSEEGVESTSSDELEPIEEGTLVQDKGVDVNKAR